MTPATVVVRRAGLLRTVAVVLLCLALMWRYWVSPAVDTVTPWDGVVPGSCGSPADVRRAGWTGMVNDAGLALHSLAEGPPTPATMVGWFGAAGREAKAAQVAFTAGAEGRQLLPLAQTPPPAVRQVAACPGPDVTDDLTFAGFSNGQIPDAALASLTFSSVKLKPSAAAALELLNVEYAAAFGRPLSVTDGYRTLAGQVTLRRSKPTLAAKPGTSNHGWGIAVDLGGGVQSCGSAEHRWLDANGPRFGWVHPAWAKPGRGKTECWHFEWTAAQAAG